MGTVSPQFEINPEILIKSLSYSYFNLIVNIDNEAKRRYGKIY